MVKDLNLLINKINVPTLIRNGVEKPKIVLVGISSLAVSYFLYKTFKLYLKTRKYSHIPGPSASG